MTETAETVGNTGPGTGRAPATNQENPVTTGATGATVWLTGLPSAGKTTIAHELAGRLRALEGEPHRGILRVTAERR